MTHLKKFNCATVVEISSSVPGTLYEILLDRANGSKNALLNPSRDDLYAECTTNGVPSIS
jgi:hypothetical protein